MKLFLNPLLALGLFITLISCSNSTETPTEDPKTTGTGIAEATAPDAASAPYKFMLIKHSVADYEKWKVAYAGHDSIRKAYGLTDLALLRAIDNPGQVQVVEKIMDVQKAKDFAVLPNLKEAMQKAGVESAPEFSYYDVVRTDDSEIDTKDRIVVTHRVKDYDTWLKAYDGEGKATRASEGMVDRVLARGIDDPNLVHIVFAVTDMTRAKAAVSSKSKKQLMVSAGVEGVPTIEFYKIAE